MVRNGSLAVLVTLVVLSAAPAQTAAWRFRWQTGQVLAYKVEQTMAATEVTPGGKIESKTKLNLTKRWQVQAVDAAGVATLQLSLAAMRLETTTPAGEPLIFDSADADKSDAQLKEQLGRYINTPLAVLRIDGRGQVVEVKESKFGPATKYETELPFAITLPDAGPQASQAWERPYKVTLEPPQGAGEKYDAVQKCVCKAVSGAAATVTVTAVLKALPEAAADQAPLLQMQPEGEVVFDVQNGRLHSVNLHIDKELKGHQGEGSSYRFQSTYTEQFAGGQ